MIGDTHTAALVGRDGSIDWLCLPRFDSGACFAALLGDPSHGRWVIAPTEPFRTRRRYRPETLVLDTEHETASGAVRVTDFMTPRRAQARVVRIVEGLRGVVPMRSELLLRFDYGLAIPWLREVPQGVRAVAGPDAVHLRTEAPVDVTTGTVASDITIRAGQRVSFVLTWHRSYEPVPEKIDAQDALRNTLRYWTDAHQHADRAGAHQVQPRRIGPGDRGSPCLYGSFFQATDMRSGAPALGTPESIFGVFAGAELARRYGLPFRGGGGLCSSNAVDAQAAAESSFMLWATMLAGTDVVLHAAGWLEGGLTASLEKFALDVELLEQLQVQQQGIGFSEEEFAFDALKELGPGGLWLAAQHTMDHFREWQYISPLFITQDFTTWSAAGGEETAARANRRWKQLLDTYEDPGIDADIDAELIAYMDRRKSEPPPDED